ncbi:adenosylcobinamide-GDP ribazoletransferase family protein, partial [Roseburia intestinalis L1-82]
KLEILKDSHIGAFSVICLVLYELIYIGAYSEIDAVRQAGIVAAGFFLSRCLSGIAAMTFPGAKKEGLLYMFTSKAHERAVKTALFLQTASVAVLMLYLDGVTGVAVLVGAGLTFLYYYKKCKKELGGITGDTEGYFVTVCECVIVVAAAVCGIIR